MAPLFTRLCRAILFQRCGDGSGGQLVVIPAASAGVPLAVPIMAVQRGESAKSPVPRRLVPI